MTIWYRFKRLCFFFNSRFRCDREEVLELAAKIDAEIQAREGLINNLIAAVESVYPYLTDERIAELKAAVDAVKGTTRP